MKPPTPRAREEILKLAILKANDDLITYLYDELVEEYKNYKQYKSKIKKSHFKFFLHFF